MRDKQPIKKPMPDKTIGAMNGFWALSLRVVLATYPLLIGVLIAWATWVTTNLFELRAWKSLGAMSPGDAKILKLEITAERELALATQRANFDESMSAIRKTNLDMQGEIQKQQFEIQRLREGKTIR